MKVVATLNWDEIFDITVLVLAVGYILYCLSRAIFYGGQAIKMLVEERRPLRRIK